MNLPNGSYQVNMDLGDEGAYLHDYMGIFLEGTQVDTVSTAAGQVVSKSYTVNVVNGQLDLLLKDLGGVDPNVCIECLSITTQQVADTTPPTPNPSTWATAPYATGTTSISMTATTASDPSGVQYFFHCLTTGGHDSGWQASPLTRTPGFRRTRRTLTR